jgi:hypothetical protein
VHSVFVEAESLDLDGASEVSHSQKGSFIARIGHCNHGEHGIDQPSHRLGSGAPFSLHHSK